jgi:hypothetical protein
MYQQAIVLGQELDGVEQKRTWYAAGVTLDQRLRPTVALTGGWCGLTVAHERAVRGVRTVCLLASGVRRMERA